MSGAVEVDNQTTVDNLRILIISCCTLYRSIWRYRI